MKKISEFGISPWPWKVQEYSYKTDGPAMEGAILFNEDCNEKELFNNGLTKIANARLISASPELYECLREAVVESCHECEDDTIENCRGKCFVAKWRDALAKAVMESEMKKQ